MKASAKSLVQTRIKTPTGTLYLTASSMGLAGLGWSPMKGAKGAKDGEEVRILEKAKEQLEQYFAGQRQDFDLPLDLEGTEFQKKVWKALQTIPFGKTISYAQLAKKVGSPKAFRAVGGANGRNPVAIVVPCHRVIAANGAIGGFSGGLDKKEVLLALEQN